MLKSRSNLTTPTPVGAAPGTPPLVAPGRSSTTSAVFSSSNITWNSG